MEFNVIPLQHGTKMPIKGCNWREKEASVPFNTIDTSKNGVGLALGRYSGIVALDLDHDVDNLHNRALEISGISPVIKKGEKGCTHFYRYSGEKKHQYRKDGKVVLELLGEGSYTVIPPSIHPDTNKPYKYTSDSTLDQIEINQLPFLPTDFKSQLDILFEKVKPELKKTYEGQSNTSKEDIEEALTHIEPNGYETWINVGMALKSSDVEDSDAFCIWDCWSYDGDTYNAEKMESKWDSFNSDGGITIATIFKMAMDNGYTKKKKDANIIYKGLTTQIQGGINSGSESIKSHPLANPLYSVSKAVDVINDWKENGYPVGEYIGVPGFEGEESELNWHLRKGELTIVTGYPGDGKSEFVNFMAYSAAKKVGYRTLSFSFEEKSTAHMIESYITKHAGKIMKDRSTEEDKAAAKFIDKHFLFYDNTVMGNKIEDMVTVCEDLKDKMDIIVIDTFSNLRSDYGCSEGDMNHVKHTVQLLSQLCKKLDVHIFFIAHPTKRPPNERPTLNMKEITVEAKPDLRMVSGGAVFGNQADNGMVIKRAGFETIVTVCKIRDQNYGDCVGQVTLKYHKPSRTFKSIDKQF